MNNMLKTTIIAGFAAALCSASYAAEAAAEAAPANPVSPYFTGVTQPSMDRLSASVSFGFESEYVFRGKKEASDSFQPEVAVSYAMGENWGVYTSVWNNSPLKNSDFNETDINIGATYSIAAFTIDAGYTYYWYNDVKNGGFAATNELKAGLNYDSTELLGRVSSVLADLSITPSVYYYYDFDRMANTVELAVFSSVPVTKWMFGEDKDFLSVDTSVFYGWTSSDRSKSGGVISRSTNSYSYGGVTADLVWKVNSICRAAVGIRWAMNNDDAWGNDEQLLWYGASVSLGF